ncbi:MULTISPECIES: helix-turn-helix domain-containing protein [unclassified Nonomuraea]|uniref:helix-turn-helix domain-containing protein n=1 Tax=unclassified Nonomuraea TaxID=2593643 RepID=UPI0035BEF0DB
MHLREPAKPETTEPPAEASEPAREEGASAARTRARHAEIHQLRSQGMTITQIGRALQLSRKTLRRYATAAGADELISDERAQRQTILDAFLPYLHERWERGCRPRQRLHAPARPGLIPLGG